MSSNWHDSEFRAMLYAMLITNKKDYPNLPTIKQLAGRLGMSESAIYSWLSGEKGISPETICAIYNATKCIDIPGWFIDRCEGLRLVQESTDGLNGTISDEIIEAGAMFGKLCERWHEASGDGEIDPIEKGRMLSAVQCMEAVLDKMREELKRMAQEVTV